MVIGEKMKLKSIFVLNVNNGLQYDESDHYNAGVFLTLESAFYFLAKDFSIPYESQYANIEEWSLIAPLKNINNYQCEKVFNKGWQLLK